MNIKITEEDPNPSTGVQEKTEDIEEDHEKEKVEEDEKEENIKEHLGLNPTLVLSIIQDTIGLPQEEDIILEIPTQIGLIGLAPEENTNLTTHPQIKDDQTVGQEVVIMTKRRQGQEEMIEGGKKDTGA